jgi:hypothetical protein
VIAGRTQGFSHEYHAWKGQELNKVRHILTAMRITVEINAASMKTVERAYKMVERGRFFCAK